MKYIAIILLICASTLSACTTSSTPDSSAPEFEGSSEPSGAVSSPNQESDPRPGRMRWGGFHLDPTAGFWNDTSIYPARSAWGGFPLNLDGTNISSTTVNSVAECLSSQEFCIIQHPFSFQRPFSSVFNTSVENSYAYGSTQFGAYAPHHGVEILNPTGTPVLAVADGMVIVAGNDAKKEYGPVQNFYGNLVVLEHRFTNEDLPVFTLYAHLSTINVQIGQEVISGDMLGEVGATGRAIGSHLHFEVRLGANSYTNTRNPAFWFIPTTSDTGQRSGILAGNIKNAQGKHVYIPLRAEYYPDINNPPERTFYFETYAPDVDPIESSDDYQENFALTDLPPGYYRLVFNASRFWIDRWVEVQPGKLSFLTIE